MFPNWHQGIFGDFYARVQLASHPGSDRYFLEKSNDSVIHRIVFDIDSFSSILCAKIALALKLRLRSRSSACEARYNPFSCTLLLYACRDACFR
jgi:hypothetical protein